MEEVKKHNSPTDCWTVFNGIVYDITPFISMHPGGVENIMKLSGKDGKLEFMRAHPAKNAEVELKKYLIGKVKE